MLLSWLFTVLRFSYHSFTWKIHGKTVPCDPEKNAFYFEKKLQIRVYGHIDGANFAKHKLVSGHSWSAPVRYQ